MNNHAKYHNKARYNVAASTSFLLILWEATNTMVVPMFFALLPGLLSISAGLVLDFLISLGGIFASVRLLIPTGKRNGWVPLLCIVILVAIAVYSIISSQVPLPVYSIVSLGIFFISASLCLLNLFR